MAKLDERQVVPLTCDEKNRLLEISNTQGITPGLLSRAVLTHGLNTIEPAAMTDLVAQAQAEATARTSDGARRAVAQRWGNR